MQQQLIAHRGWQKHFPENSLQAVAQAINCGAKHIEIDIQLTADHQAVLCHDTYLQRLCGQDGQIDQLTLAELGDYSFHEPDRLGQRFVPTPVCTLAQCVQLLAPHPDVQLYVEIKRHALRSFGAETVLAALNRVLAPISAQVTLISFDMDVLHQAKAAGWPRLAPVLIDWAQLQSPALRALQPALVFCDAEKIPAATDFRQLDCALAIYEVDQPAAARQLLARGAALIESFDIGGLLGREVSDAGAL